MPTVALPVNVPNINGRYYSFASITATVFGQPFVEFTAINYTSSLEPGDVYGSRSQKLGTTRGKQNAEGTLELLLPAWERFRKMLAGGQGYGQVPFLMTVQYAEAFMPVITDQLYGCRITRTERSNSDGTDGSKVGLTLNIMRVLEGATRDRIDAALGIGI